MTYLCPAFFSRPLMHRSDSLKGQIEFFGGDLSGFRLRDAFGNKLGDEARRLPRAGQPTTFWCRSAMKKLQ